MLRDAFQSSGNPYFVTQISSMNQRENSPEAGSLVKRRAVEAVAPSSSTTLRRPVRSP